MLINIDAETYYNKFNHDPHPFISQKFTDINKNKVERILRLVEDNPSPSLGLTLGLKDGYLLSPFSAPFGGFHFNHELIYINVIQEYINNLKSYIKTNELKGIQITLPPNIYNQTFNSKLINCLLISDFNIKNLDITSCVDLQTFANKFNERSSRHHLNQAIKFGLKFRKVEKKSEKHEVYELIRKNRALLGRPIFMTFNDIEEVNKIWDIDFFAVIDENNELLASSINYRSHQTIVYGVFWGDNMEGRPKRAMDFCIYNLLNYYKQSGYKYMDIGISTEEGIPNEGLLRFKETHEAMSSLRYTLYWSNTDFTNNDSNKSVSLNSNINLRNISLFNSGIKKNEAMETIHKYGITLRLVELEDAEFIYNLRTNKDLNKFISFTSLDFSDQVKWIKDYKNREYAGNEFYYIAQDHIGNKYGTIRLYNLDKKSFELGSWLFQTDSPLGMAVKAHFIGFEIGFEELKAEYCRFEIRKKNKAVLKYMKDFRTTLVNEDDLNFYFTLSKENFYKRRNQLPIFSSHIKDLENEYFVHNSSDVQTTKIGKGTSIWQYCIVLKNAVIGENCNINYNVFIENDVIVGNNVTIKSGVQLWDGMRIEDNVFISPNVSFTNDFAPRSKQYPIEFLKTYLKEGASIGANSTIIGGLTIGKYAMIGAGSIITKNIPDYTLWYGSPAVFKANICKCGNKLDSSLVCSKCNTRYNSKNGIISEQ